MKLLNVFLFLLFTGVSVLAQKAITEGVIVLELTDIKSDDASMQSMLNSMKGATTETVFSPTKQKIVMAMMGGMLSTKIFYDVKSKESKTYMDMMGNKILLKSDDKEAGKEDGEVDFDIEELNETKTIQGYTCKKIRLKLKNTGADGNIYLYVTDKIKTAQTSFGNNMTTTKINGTPLEMKIAMQGMTMTYTAKSVSDKLPKDAFVEPKGYKEMSLEEFQKSMGQMGF